MKKYLILLIVLGAIGLVVATPLLPNEICFDIYGGGEFCFLNHTINHSLSVIGDLNVTGAADIGGGVNASIFNGEWNGSSDYYTISILQNGTFTQSGDATWNKTYADTLYADISVTGDNSSWNESYADTLYQPIITYQGTRTACWTENSKTICGSHPV